MGAKISTCTAVERGASRSEERRHPILLDEEYKVDLGTTAAVADDLPFTVNVTVNSLAVREYIFGWVRVLLPGTVLYRSCMEYVLFSITVRRYY